MKFKFNNQVINLSILCFLMFCYGMILLMIGYTNVALTSITGLKPNQSIILAIPQSVAVIVGVLSLHKLLKHFNIRTIVVTGMGLTVIALIFITFLDKISGYSTHQNHTSATQLKGLIIFVIAGFCLGLGISYISPISVTYISSVFTHKKRILWLSITNGAFGLGAGIVPLAATSSIVKINTSNAVNFETIRVFYIIALCAAIVSFICAWALDHRHHYDSLHMSEESFASNNRQSANTMTKKQFQQILQFIIAFFICYVVVETTFNYSFGNFTAANVNSVNYTRFIQAFGLFLLLQGLYRCFCGLLGQYLKDRYFIIMSVVFILIGVSILLGMGIKYQFRYVPTWVPWVVGAIMSLGIGNLWPTLLNFSAKLNTQKSVLISIWATVCGKIVIPVTQIMITIVFQIGTPTGEIVVLIINFVAAIGVVIGVWWAYFYVRKHKFTIDASYKQSIVANTTK